MPSIAGPAGLFNGLRQSFSAARGANPRTVPAPASFNQHLDLAVRSGIGGGLAGSAVAGASTSDEPASIDSVRVENQTAMAEFEQRFRQLLQEHGIELRGGVVLAANEQGRVTVLGEHPQKSAIEQLFRDNAELQSEFVKIARQTSLLRAADVYGKLGGPENVADDATAHVEQILKSAMQGTFSLAIRPSGMVVEFR